ncbi:hypothetical protein Plec18170_001686 [Paecilomyces lecythidis]
MEPMAAVIGSIEDFPALPTPGTSLPKEEIKENQSQTAVGHQAEEEISQEVSDKHDDNKVDATVEYAAEAVVIERNEGEEAPESMTEEVSKDTAEEDVPMLLDIARDETDESTVAPKGEEAKDVPVPAETIEQQAAPPTTASDTQSKPKSKKKRLNNKRRQNHRDRAKRRIAAEAARAAAGAAAGATTADNEDVAEADPKYPDEVAPVPFNWQYEQVDTLLGSSNRQETSDNQAYSPLIRTYSGMDAMVPADASFLPPRFATMGYPTYSYMSPYAGLGVTMNLANPGSPLGEVAGLGQYSPFPASAAFRRSMFPPPGLGYSPPRPRGTSRFFPRESVNDNRNQNQGQADAAENTQSPELRATAPAFVPSDKET